MKQFARLKFSSFNLTVPTNWRQPQGEAAEHFGKAFKDSEKSTAPDTSTIPPLFKPATMNKYHTDAQKMHNAKFGSFIDRTCAAICQAWSTWQSAASMAGIMVNAVTASAGQLVGPPWTPIILASGAKNTPMEMKYTTAIANVLGTAWLSYTATIKVPGLPWYPAFAAVPSPVAPPVPNIPCSLATLAQVPASLAPPVLKSQMVAALADPTAPFHDKLFEAIIDGFDKCFKIWQTTTMVTNVIGTGPVPTFAPPVVPAGPVVAGTAVMAPGGLV